MKNLSPREKILAIAILALLPICLLPLGVLFAMNSLGTRRDMVDGLMARRDNLELNKRKWMNAELVRKDLRALSLPGDAEQASSAYRNWLLTLGTEVFGGDAVRVQHTGDINRKLNDFDVYRESRFTMVTVGSLAQLITFLESYYKLDCLQRISNLSIIPIQNPQTQQPTKMLTLKFTFEAISVSGSEESRDISRPAVIQDESLRLLLPEQFAEWKDHVMRRNVFGLPNNAPKLSRLGTKRFVRGEPIEVKISARDTDDGDSLVYVLEESPMEGARIEQDPGDDSAMLIAPDLGIGTYTFVIAVRDDGYPAKEDRQEFEIEVEEPEVEPQVEPEAPFDPSTLTYITGIVRDISGVEQVFLHIKPTGEMLKLQVGQEFEVGSVTGKVISIEEGKTVLEVDGEQSEFRPGQQLKKIERSSSRSRRR